MSAIGSFAAMQMEAPSCPPDDDGDEPYIHSHVGDIPVKVFYSTDRSGAVDVLRIEDDQQRDLPVRSLAMHELLRLRRECEREGFA